MSARTPGALELLRALYASVDRRVAELTVHHAERMACRRGCNACCVDELSVFAVEADNIADRFPDLAAMTPARRGVCVFLGEDGACRIYEARPYVCRTQGLPLRWLESDARGETHELRDVCPVHAERFPLESLTPAECLTLGVAEEHLARIAAWDAQQKGADPAAPPRVRLRGLVGGGA